MKEGGKLRIEEIKLAIENDPMNIDFTKKGWHPIFTAYPGTKLLLIGPAPGMKTQEKADVFRDKSGDRLREWLGVSEELFYNSGKISVVPLDFYFPGKAKTGDLPSRAGFTKKWHPEVLKLMPEVDMTVLIGQYAQLYYLGKSVKPTLSETVLSYKDYLPHFFPIPHPSPLNFRWLNNHPEFEKNITLDLKKKVTQSLIK